MMYQLGIALLLKREREIKLSFSLRRHQTRGARARVSECVRRRSVGLWLTHTTPKLQAWVRRFVGDIASRACCSHTAGVSGANMYEADVSPAPLLAL